MGTFIIPSGVMVSPEYVFKGIRRRNICLYFCNGIIDTADPVSSSIFTACPSILVLTQMVLLFNLLTLFISTDATKLSSSSTQK
jgi:hypothetical protein